MAIAVPIKDLKETKQFSQLVNENDEVIVTKNGYSDFHCISTKQREAELMELAQAKLMKRTAIAEMEIATGKHKDFDKFMSEIQAEYEI